jgi:hypothetical protein
VQPRSIYVERTVNKLIGLVKEATDKGLLPLVEVADAQRLTEIRKRLKSLVKPDPPSQLPQNNC